MYITVLIFSIIFSLTAMMSEVSGFKWWLRAFDFPKIQLLVLFGLLFVTVVLIPFHWLSGLAYVVMVPAMVHTAAHIYPYISVAKNDSRTALNTGPELSLLMSNVQMENTHYDKVLKTVQKQDSDIVLLIETNSAWHQQMAPLKEQYPYHIEFPNEEHSGLLFYSKYPFEDGEVRYLVKDYIPSIRATIKFKDHDIVFYGVHPRPPRPQNSAFGRDTELWVVAQEVQDIDKPVIVAGDLNDVGWSDTTTRFRDISGLKDPRRGRGFYNSFNANHWWARWPLDHLFHSDHFSVERLERLPHVGSDHFPILVALELDKPGLLNKDNLTS